MRRVTGAIVFVMALAACGGQNDASMPEGMGLPDEDARTILSIDRSFQDAVKMGDWRTLRGLYAADAVHMPPAHAAVEGVDSIVAYWENTYPDDGIVGFNTDTEVIHGDNTIAYHRGTFSSDAEMMRRGKFLWVMRRMPDGEWRIVADMYNMDRPTGPRMMPER